MKLVARDWAACVAALAINDATYRFVKAQIRCGL